MPQSGKKPTMRDVSRLARVSAMTVSRVLADPESATPATRERVLAAVEQLGYVPDMVAGALSSRRTHFIGLILPTLTNSNFGDTAQGLSAELAADRAQLLIGYTLYRGKEEERLVRTLLGRRPDALVIAGNVHSTATRRMLDQSGIPVVEIWETTAQPLYRTVGFSNYETGRAAARHLIELGHRRIGAIGTKVAPDICDYRGEARLKGFAAALREAGIADDLVLRVDPAPAAYGQGARAMGLLLERAPEVEAVFAVSDLSAMGALMECRRRGIDVPGQVSLMGFGDFEIGRISCPSLTTISVDAEGIGRRAGQLIRCLLGGAAEEPREIDVGFTLHPRETTAPR